VLWLQNKLSCQLAGCFGCAMAFQRARAAACAGRDGNEVMDGLNKWDVARLGQAFSSEGNVATNHTLCAYMEVLMRPRILNIGDMNEVFTACLKATLERDGQLALSAGQWLTGLYYLCGHPDGKVRGWAREQAVGLGIVQEVSTFLELECVFEDFIAGVLIDECT
jgi:hypothetical protein